MCRQVVVLSYIAKLYKLGMEFNNFYEIGRNAEIQVCDILQKLGWQTDLSPGSKGPADIHAIKDAIKWCIQVKYTSTGSYMQLCDREESRLLRHSTGCKCKPVFAIVTKYPGGLLLIGSNVRDEQKPFVIRNTFGKFFGIDDDTALFFYDLLNGRKIEP